MLIFCFVYIIIICRLTLILHLEKDDFSHENPFIFIHFYNLEILLKHCCPLAFPDKNGRVTPTWWKSFCIMTLVAPDNISKMILSACK